METKKLLQADYLDIIFDQRNKNYGGYELRKNYDRRVRKATIILLLGIVGLSSFSLVRSSKPEEVIVNTTPIAPTIIDITPPKIIPKILPPEQTVVPPKPASTHIFTDPVITNDPILPDQHMTENKKLVNSNPGNTNNTIESPDIVPGVSGHKGTGVVDPPVIAENKILIYVEQMPQFIGSMEEYLGNNLHYPESARTNNIDGRVIVQFVVNEDGSVSGVQLVRGIGGGCDEEAMRMVSGMPKWKPGKQNGKPVKVLFTLPIKFVLN
jgi:protein TonB